MYVKKITKTEGKWLFGSRFLLWRHFIVCFFSLFIVTFMNVCLQKYPISAHNMTFNHIGFGILNITQAL